MPLQSQIQQRSGRGRKWKSPYGNFNYFINIYEHENWEEKENKTKMKSIGISLIYDDKMSAKILIQQ